MLSLIIKIVEIVWTFIQIWTWFTKTHRNRFWNKERRKIKRHKYK